MSREEDIASKSPSPHIPTSPLPLLLLRAFSPTASCGIVSLPLRCCPRRRSLLLLGSSCGGPHPSLFWFDLVAYTFRVSSFDARTAPSRPPQPLQSYLVRHGACWRLQKAHLKRPFLLQPSPSHPTHLIAHLRGPYRRGCGC